MIKSNQAKVQLEELDGENVDEYVVVLAIEEMQKDFKAIESGSTNKFHR